MPRWTHVFLLSSVGQDLLLSPFTLMHRSQRAPVTLPTFLWALLPLWHTCSRFVSFSPAQPETRSLSKEPGLFQWSIVFRKPVLGTSGGEGVPSYENIAAPMFFLSADTARIYMPMCWCECMFLHLSVEKLSFTPVFPLLSCMAHSSVSLHVWDFLLWWWERCLRSPQNI